jgi:glycosyltransferase involved in cell wall biosynthesis/ActR/RegA family two-component response regulator
MTENFSGLISFVIPAKDEEESLKELYERIAVEMRKLDRPFEVIFIDDGSIDGSWKVISELAADNPDELFACRFRKNAGKADALAAGFQAARGEIVFTMDADLQDDPKEIPRFIAKLDEGYDLVSGWKRTRHDPWHKVLPSRIFNRMVSSAVGVNLHDHNCGFKCYRAEVVKNVSVYGEMHRMIPSLAGIKGYRSAEIEVEHHARKFGKSKYGVKRFFRGFMDMQTVYFFKNFRERPLHFFGGTAAVCALLGAALFILGLLPWISPVIASRVTTIAEIFLISVLPLLGIGFLAEMIVHGHVEKERRPPIAEVIPRKVHLQGQEEKAISGHVLQHPQLADRPEEDNGKVETILLVDDDSASRRMVRLHLLRAGYAVEEAADVPEGISKVSDKTSVVLLDLNLGSGENDGLECLRHVRKHHADVKIIIVSGQEAIDTAVQTMKLGAFDYVIKPAAPDRLLKAVDKAIKVRKMALD